MQMHQQAKPLPNKCLPYCRQNVTYLPADPNRSEMLRNIGIYSTYLCLHEYRNYTARVLSPLTPRHKVFFQNIRVQSNTHTPRFPKVYFNADFKLTCGYASQLRCQIRFAGFISCPPFACYVLRQSRPIRFNENTYTELKIVFIKRRINWSQQRHKFSPFQDIQISVDAHPASNSVGTGGGGGVTPELMRLERT